MLPATWRCSLHPMVEGTSYLISKSSALIRWLSFIAYMSRTMTRTTVMKPWAYVRHSDLLSARIISDWFLSSIQVHNSLKILSFSCQCKPFNHLLCNPSYDSPAGHVENIFCSWGTAVGFPGYERVNLSCQIHQQWLPSQILSASLFAAANEYTIVQRKSLLIYHYSMHITVCTYVARII